MSLCDACYGFRQIPVNEEIFVDEDEVYMACKGVEIIIREYYCLNFCDDLLDFFTCDEECIVMSGPTCPSCGFWRLKRSFRPILTVDFRNVPLFTEFYTGEVLLSLFSSWHITGCEVISKYIYKVICHQIW